MMVFRVGEEVRLAYADGSVQENTLFVVAVFLNGPIKYFTIDEKQQLGKFDWETGRMLNRSVGAWNYRDCKRWIVTPNPSIQRQRV